MAKKKSTKITCSCGAEFELPHGMKGEFTCECGERFGINAEKRVEVLPAPYPVYPPSRPWRPYWRYLDPPYYTGDSTTTPRWNNGPNVGSAGVLAPTYPPPTINAISTTSGTYKVL